MTKTQLKQQIFEEIEKVKDSKLTYPNIHTSPIAILVEKMTNKNNFGRMNTYHFNLNKNNTIHFIPTVMGCSHLTHNQKESLNCICWHRSKNNQWVRSEHKVFQCPYR